MRGGRGRKRGREGGEGKGRGKKVRGERQGCEEVRDGEERE